MYLYPPTPKINAWVLSQVGLGQAQSSGKSVELFYLSFSAHASFRVGLFGARGLHFWACFGWRPWLAGSGVWCLEYVKAVKAVTAFMEKAG